MKTSKFGARRVVIAALSVAGVVWAGVSVAQQQPAPKPSVAAEDKPLPRKADLPELGEPPADFGAGAAPIRNDVKPTAILAQVDDPDAPDAPKRANPLLEANAKANPNDVTLVQAHAIIQAAAQKAAEINTKMDIAVVDAGGNLKGFVRMDGAWLGSIDISIKKAKTARYFDMNTGEIGKLSQPGGPLFGIEHSNGGLITFPGGVPLRNADGTVIGAIGVSGSTVENDHEVAAAGAKALAPKKAADADARATPPVDVEAKPAAARSGPAAAGRIDDREPAAPVTVPAPKRSTPPAR